MALVDSAAPCHSSPRTAAVRWRGLRGLALAGALTACAASEEASAPQPVPHLVELSQLPGWQQDASFEAYPALLASCGVIEILSSDKALGIGGSPTEWREACDAIKGLRAALVSDTDGAVRPIRKAWG